MDDRVKEGFSLDGDRAGIYFHVALLSVGTIMGGEKMLLFLILCPYEISDNLFPGQTVEVIDSPGQELVPGIPVVPDCRIVCIPDPAGIRVDDKRYGIITGEKRTIPLLAFLQFAPGFRKPGKYRIYFQGETGKLVLMNVTVRSGWIASHFLPVHGTDYGIETGEDDPVDEQQDKQDNEDPRYQQACYEGKNRAHTGLVDRAGFGLHEIQPPGILQVIEMPVSGNGIFVLNNDCHGRSRGDAGYCSSQRLVCHDDPGGDQGYGKSGPFTQVRKVLAVDPARSAGSRQKALQNYP